MPYVHDRKGCSGEKRPDGAGGALRISIRQEERLMAYTVTKETLIGDILDHDSTTAEYFFEMGMHCLGCPSARGESLGEEIGRAHV